MLSDVAHFGRASSGPSGRGSLQTFRHNSDVIPFAFWLPRPVVPVMSGQAIIAMSDNTPCLSAATQV